MSEIGEKEDLDQILKEKKRVYVLFYASWCPFSQKFLPIFRKYSGLTKESCVRVMMDNKDSLCEKYSIELFPTVILFEDGKMSERLDSKPHVGLNESQLKAMLDRH